MRKTDKKTENAIRVVLTEVCEFALEYVNGFQWLTHSIGSYKSLPETLTILCVFNTEDDLISAQENSLDQSIMCLISKKLNTLNIPIKDIQQHVRFDTQEACNEYHQGKWQDRFKKVLY